MIDIKKKNGAVRLSVEVTSKCIYTKSIMGEEYILLSFESDKLIHLAKGDYIETVFGAFKILKIDKPKMTSRGGYQYEQRFHPKWWNWYDYIVFYNRQNGSEKAWKMTQRPEYFLDIIVSNVSAAGLGEYTFSVDANLTEMKLIEFDGTSIIEALNKIAEAWETEWWITDNVIHISRCEYGSPVLLKVDDALSGMEREDGQDTTYITRMYAFGSTRNLRKNYRANEDSNLIVEGVVESRLKLPEGIPYVDAWDNMADEDVVEGVVIFDEVYPHRIGTISTVTTKEYTDTTENDDGTTTEEKWNAFRFTDAGLTFSKEYIIEGNELRLIFQSGKLAGMDFALTFNPDGLDESEAGAQVFEIVRSEDYGIELPADDFAPAVGDTYVLYGYDTQFIADTMEGEAEQELYEKTVAKVAQTSKDKSVYNCPTNPIRCAGYIENKDGELEYDTANEIDLDIGQYVTLQDENYFGTSSRTSRVYSFEKRLDNKFVCTYTIGDTSEYSIGAALNEKVNELTYKANQFTNSYGSSVYVIKKYDSTVPTDHNVFSALRTLMMFMRKDIPDSTKYLMRFFDGIEAGKFSSGLSGAKIDKDGNAEINKLFTRALATIAELVVKGSSTFIGNLSSEEFISGMTSGKGWAIIKQEIENALGVKEAKYTGEFDNIIVRGVLRVLEFIASQMLGENDNRTFSGMLEVEYYDAQNNKVYLNTREGKLYNPFRKGDYIMVQQYNGMPSEENNYYITKHYELIVTEAGIGNPADKENRLDWMKFSNFVSADGNAPKDVISKGDTFTRVDSATDEDRKGLIQIITVGAATPYMDIVHGLKTNPDDALKGRLGNLKGIHHHLFGWLQGFGEFLINLYAVGDFRLRRTGESLDAKIEMLRAVFATQYQRINYDITEENNYLKNASFTEALEGWERENDADIISSNGSVLMINGSTTSATSKIATIAEYDGRNMLRLRNSYIKQANSLIRKPGTHKEYKEPTGEETEGSYVEVKDTLYMSVKFLAKSSGTLTIGMDGAKSEVGCLANPATVAVTSSMEWQNLQWEGTWDSVGDFVLKYTGEMYVSLLSITDKPLDALRKEVSTSIEQTATNIRLLGTNIDNVKGSVTQLGIDLDAANERITIYANKTTTLETELGGLTTTVTNLGFDLDAANERITIYANKTTTLETELGGLTTTVAAIRIDVDSISSTVVSVKGDLEEAEKVAAAASKAAHDRADEAYDEADSAWLKAYYAQLAADGAQSTADDAYAKSVSNATAIEQNATSISAIAGLFDENGKLLEGSGWVLTSDYNALYTKVYAMDGKLAAKAEISTSVQYDPDTGYVTSDIILSADKIKLEGYTSINDTFIITTDGVVSVKGTITVNAFLSKIIPEEGSLKDGSMINSPGYYIAPKLSNGKTQIVYVTVPRLSRTVYAVTLTGENNLVRICPNGDIFNNVNELTFEAGGVFIILVGRGEGTYTYWDVFACSRVELVS